MVAVVDRAWQREGSAAVILGSISPRSRRKTCSVRSLAVEGLISLEAAVVALGADQVSSEERHDSTRLDAFTNGSVHQVFTFGGPNGFRQFGGNQGMHARARDGRRESPPPNWVQMLPLLFLVFIGLLSWLPGMFSTPDPGYQWKSISPWTLHKQTSSINVDYWVNPREWQRHPIFESIPEGKRGMEQAGTYSNKLKRFESGIEQHYVSTLRQQVSETRGRCV